MREVSKSQPDFCEQKIPVAEERTSLPPHARRTHDQAKTPTHARTKAGLMWGNVFLADAGSAVTEDEREVEGCNPEEAPQRSLLRMEEEQGLGSASDGWSRTGVWLMGKQAERVPIQCKWCGDREVEERLMLDRNEAGDTRLTVSWCPRHH